MHIKTITDISLLCFYCNSSFIRFEPFQPLAYSHLRRHCNPLTQMHCNMKWHPSVTFRFHIDFLILVCHLYVGVMILVFSHLLSVGNLPCKLWDWHMPGQLCGSSQVNICAVLIGCQSVFVVGRGVSLTKENKLNLIWSTIRGPGNTFTEFITVMPLWLLRGPLTWKMIQNALAMQRDDDWLLGYSLILSKLGK